MPDQNVALYKGNDDDDYIDEIEEAFDNALLSFQFQDRPKTDQALMQAKTAFKRLSPSIDNIVKLFAEAELNCIKLFSGLLRLMFYQMEQKFEKSYKEYLDCVMVCQQGFDVASRLNSDDNNENHRKILLGYLFKIYELFLEGLGMQIQMQIDIKKGKVVSQPNILLEAATCLKRIEELDFVNDPTIIAIREMMKRTVEAFENSAERITEEQKTIKFFPALQRKIFIIHGHDEGDLRVLEKMLEETFHLETIVLKDEAGLGESVIEKFEENARFCGYAIALLTPDDIVKNKASKYFQARPNVLFELGWFCGRFGRSRVCIIKQKQIQLPSDLGGVITLDYFESVEELQGKLTKELRAAGIMDN